MKGIGINRERPDRTNHFFNRAKTAAERSSCLRRMVGAVIINKDGVEISSGYVGSPRGVEDCLLRGVCFRIELGIKSGQNYELCRSVHAEQNAIINAARVGTSIVGCDMYIYSKKILGTYPSEGEKKDDDCFLQVGIPHFCKIFSPAPVGKIKLT